MPSATGSSFFIHLFGPFEACLRTGSLLRLRSRKEQWLLALLTLQHDRPRERAWLAGMLWPDSSQTQALANLRNCLAGLRHALGPEAHRLGSPTPRTLALDLDGAEVDVFAFDAALTRGDEPSLAHAVGLYRGPLLEDCPDVWALQERQLREQAFLQALEQLAADASARGVRGEAEGYLRRAIGVDPLRESAQRALMQLLAEGGRYAAALQVYRELRLRLHQELNAEPDPETTALFQQLRVAARERAAPRSPVAARANRTSVALHPIREANGSSSPTENLEPSDHSAPKGTVTFLFTDIEGSTRLWEEHPEAMRTALARHDALLHRSLEAHGGFIFKSFGDQFCAAFTTAPDAMTAALAAQRALQAEEWHEVGALPVRMALHTGTAEERDGDYFGPALNRLARLLEAGHGGQILLSLATVELVRDPLPVGADLRDLGLRRLRDLTRPEQIFQLVAPDLPSNFPPLRSLEAFPNNLPQPLTSFIGREEQMAEVEELLAAHRLVTLTGAGGCGKTRLALQVAAGLVAGYADGVWLVELAALADPALVPQAVAGALGVREEPGRALLATLTDYLRPKSLLLLLDNCEHLLTACAQLADHLLRGCPHLWILTTTREALGLAGERTYRVPSLSLPDLPRLTATGVDLVAALTYSEAVRLFVERAVFSQPSFAVKSSNALPLAQVCQRLDGIPLAIELAAARVKALSVEKIAERLDDRFRLLSGGSRTALPRHQTLRALIDWSYDLLSEAERTLLRRLSVFAGGWTLEAAEVVCSGDGIEDCEVLDLLTQLVQKSLVLYEAREEEDRYRLLETVRQYARDRLLEVGESEVVRARHRDWVVALAERAGPELFGREQAAWLERLEGEHDNLRAALAWSGAQGQVEAGLRLAGALGRFWDLRGYWAEGREQLAGLLALPRAEIRTVARAKALLAGEMLATDQGDYRAARALVEESLAIYRETGHKVGIASALARLGWIHGDRRAALELWEESLAISRELGNKVGIADLLHGLGGAARQRGDYEAARALHEESLAISRELGNKESIAGSFAWLGNLARDQGDYGAAWAHFEESLAICREIGFKQGIASSLRWLGTVARERRDYEAARALHEESLPISRELGNKRGIACSLIELGRAASGQGEYGAARALYEEGLAISRELGYKEGAAYERIAWSLDGLAIAASDHGDYGAARALHEESLAIHRELGDKQGIVKDVEGLAAVAVAQGQPERAAHFFGAAEALREAIGSPLPPADRADYDRSFAATRAALGEKAFAAAWAAGRAMSPEQAVACALEEERQRLPSEASDA